MEGRTSKWSLTVSNPKVTVTTWVVKQTCDVDLARQGHIGLADGAEQSAVVDQPCDAIVDDEFSEKFVVQHVSVHKWA